MNPLDDLEVKLAGIRIRVPPYFRINERGHREDVSGYTRTLRIGDPSGADDDLTPYERRALANRDPSKLALVDKLRQQSATLRDLGPLQRLEAKIPFEPDPTQADYDEANTMAKFLPPEQQWGAQTGTPSITEQVRDILVNPEQHAREVAAGGDPRVEIVRGFPNGVRWIAVAVPDRVEARNIAEGYGRVTEEDQDLNDRWTFVVETPVGGVAPAEPGWGGEMDEPGREVSVSIPDVVEEPGESPRVQGRRVSIQEPIRWGVSEWADEGTTAYLRGYEADAWQRMGGGAPGEPWADYDWTVKATSDVSEWPELYDSGSANSLSAAQKAAEAALRRAAAKAPRTNPTTGELNPWARSTTS